MYTDEPHRSSHLLEPAGARRSHRRDGDQRPGVVRAVERGDGGDGRQDQDGPRHAVR